MQLNEYSPEPSRAKFIDRKKDIGIQASTAASILFDPDCLENNCTDAERQSMSLHGARMMSVNDAENALFHFLSDTSGIYTY